MNAAILSRRFGACLLIAALALVAGCVRKRAPVVLPGEEGNGAPGAPPKVIKDVYRGPATFGATGCPIVVVGTKVWDVKQNKELRELEGAIDSSAVRALSASGRWFAAGSKSANQTDTAVTLWSTQTGKKVFDIPGKKDAYADLLTFAGDKHFLLGGRHSKEIEVWDVEKKAKAHTITFPDRRLDAGRMAVSPDGRSFAYVGYDKIGIHELSTGREVKVMPPPTARPTDAVFICAWTSGLKFSPDGKELAAFSTHPQPRMLCWSIDGKQVLDEPVTMTKSVGYQKLEWLPDRSGWLIDGWLFDRASKRVLLRVRVPPGSQVLPHVLDKDHIVGAFRGGDAPLQTVPIPWARLRASLRQLNDKAPAFLTPAEPISLEVDTTGARGDVEGTRKVLTEALTKRLARDGISVGDKRPTVLRLRLAEQAGETLPIYERQSAFDFRGKKTDRKATEAKGAAVVELMARGETAALWRGHLTAASSRSFSEDINDVTIRKSMLERLAWQLSSLDMPYFIPRSPEHVALPAIIE